MLFDRLKQITGRERIADIWPTLRLVVHGGTKFDPYRTLFRREIGSDDVHFLETYPCSEGFVATEDPRYDLLRLIPDHGIFFEFVPVEELGKDRPGAAHGRRPGAGRAVRRGADDLCRFVELRAGRHRLLREAAIRRCCASRAGRSYFLSAFGEHLISEEVERAVAAAADATGCRRDRFPRRPGVSRTAPAQPGRHRYLVEFAQSPPTWPASRRSWTRRCAGSNEDYQAHRHGDLSAGGAGGLAGAARRLRRLAAVARQARRPAQGAAHGQQRPTDRGAVLTGCWPSKQLLKTASRETGAR